MFSQEEQAYEKISMLSWILPLIIMIGALTDTILVVIYMKLAHPWQDILFSHMKMTEEAQPFESDTQDAQIQVRFPPLYLEKKT